LLSACDDPFLITAGGKLSGPISEVPTVWQLGEASTVAQLETRPNDPYSINLTYVQLNGRLYVYAGDTQTNWVAAMEQDPLVRIRISGTVYPARAIRITDQREIEAFADFWASRSMFQRDPLQFDEVWLYHLVAR